MGAAQVDKANLDCHLERVRGHSQLSHPTRRRHRGEGRLFWNDTLLESRATDLVRGHGCAHRGRRR